MAGSERDLDFTSLLTVINIIAVLGTVVLWFFWGANDYVNLYSVLLAAALAAQNHFLLLAGRKTANPFLPLLVFCSIFFYELRVASLLFSPWSSVLPRNPFSPDNLAQALLFVIGGNFFIFLGLTLGGTGNEQGLFRDERPALNLPAAAGILFLTLFCNWGCDYAGWLKGYIVILFNLELVFLLSLVYLLQGFDTARPSAKFVIYAMLLAYLIFRTSLGSRSAMLTLLVLVICAMLAIKGRIKISRRLFFPALIAVPVSLVLFMVGTSIRTPSSIFSLRQIWDRSGFLDMAADIISNVPRYSGIINGGYYAKSLVDSGLTPGFNIFDTPKAANALVVIYNGYLVNSLSNISSHYQSDMFTVYGETYALFGSFFGLISMGVISFLFARAYRAFSSSANFVPTALRTLLLYIFYFYFLNSFGADWFLVDLFRGGVPFLLFLWLFSTLEKSEPGTKAKG